MPVAFRRFCTVILALLLGLSGAAAEQDDADTSLDNQQASPVLTITVPAAGQSYDGSEQLTVRVEGRNISLITL